MSKVTSKLQITLPKAIADEYRIKPGDDVLWVASGDAIRLIPGRQAKPHAETIAAKLRVFDEAMARVREGSRGKERRAKDPAKERGWAREDLYDRGRSR